MDIKTHQNIDSRLCGSPVEIRDNYCKIEMTATKEMAADKTGLVHGGFIFGMADYAAMLAVNHPNVVLGAADTRFLKPVTAGSRVSAEAAVDKRDGKKVMVNVVVYHGTDKIFEGTFTCFTPEKHVLE